MRARQSQPPSPQEQDRASLHRGPKPYPLEGGQLRWTCREECHANRAIWSMPTPCASPCALTTPHAPYGRLRLAGITGYGAGSRGCGVARALGAASMAWDTSFKTGKVHKERRDVKGKREKRKAPTQRRHEYICGLYWEQCRPAPGACMSATRPSGLCRHALQVPHVGVGRNFADGLHVPGEEVT